MIPDQHKDQWLQMACYAEREDLIKTAQKMVIEYATLNTSEWKNNYVDVLEMFRCVGKFRFDQSFVIEYNQATNYFLTFRKRLKES